MGWLIPGQPFNISWTCLDLDVYIGEMPQPDLLFAINLALDHFLIADLDRNTLWLDFLCLGQMQS
jgi:hypothetical protein